MHILIVTQYFWPERFRINDIAVGLVKKGHQVTVLTGMPNYPQGKLFKGYSYFSPKKESYCGVNILRVPVVTRGSSKGLRLVVNYLSFALSSCIMMAFLDLHAPDLVLSYQTSPIFQALPAVLAKKIMRIPLVLYVQDLWPESLSAVGAVKSTLVLGLVRRLVNWIYEQSSLILVQSRGFIPFLEREGVYSEKIQYLPNTAESVYRPLVLPSDSIQHQMMPNGFCFMFAGNLGQAQDFPTILGAMKLLKKYKDIHLVILGDGRERKCIERLVVEFGLVTNVHLLGAFPMDSMPGFFSLADVLLVSLKDQPIFSLTIPAKVQSYMACAKPIVGSLHGEGRRVILEAECGLCSEPEDSTSLASVMLEIYMSTPDQREQMGMKARQYFKNNFEREMVLSQLEKLLNQQVSNVQCES